MYQHKMRMKLNLIVPASKFLTCKGYFFEINYAYIMHEANKSYSVACIINIQDVLFQLFKFL